MYDGVSGVPVALVEWRGRRRRELAAPEGCCAGLRRFAAGVAESVSAVGEKTLTEKKYAKSSLCIIGGGATAVYSI